TPLQVNDTEIRSWSAGGDWQPWDGSLALRASGSSQGFFQTFSSVAANRESETLTRTQEVPVRAVAAAAQATAALSRSQALGAGADLSQVDATNRELGFLAGGVTSPSAVAARQRTGGVFLEDLADLSPRVALEAGLRGDAWRNQARREAGPGGPLP